MTLQKAIVLTGASGKLGRVMLTHLLQSGYDVIATTHGVESAAALRQQSEESFASGRLLIWTGDLADPAGVGDLTDFIGKSGRRPYGLINNARNVATLKVEQDGRVSRTNFGGELILEVVAPYELTMALAALEHSILARVVNITSMYGVVAANPSLYDDAPRQSPIHYGVAKAALIHLTRELAVRLAPRAICVNAVAFGGVEGRVDSAFAERYARLSPAGRMLREDEITAPVSFLLSEGASGVTGHNLVVDGGWTAW